MTLNTDPAIRGSLFATDSLNDPESLGELSAWNDLTDQALRQIETGLRETFEGFAGRNGPNETETDDDLIWPTLAQLGWTAHLRQQNLSSTGRLDVPDGLLFADVPPVAYERTFGPKSAAEIVREAVLELTYTAHDMAAFARDLGHVDAEGAVLPPFPWDEERRVYLRAKLDALYFHLYGITERDDVRYLYSTFPIVERQEVAAYGTFRSRDLCLA